MIHSIATLALPGAILAAMTSAPVIEGPLTLGEAVRLALLHNRTLEAVVLEKEIARGRVVEAWSGVLPQVTLEGSYERLSELPGFLLDLDDPGSVVTFGFLDSTSVDLTLVQPLYRGGQASIALRASRLSRSLADEQVRGAAQDVVYLTTRDYYEVMLAREQSRLAQNNLRLTEVQLADTETKKRFGVASEFNVLRARVEVSGARAQEILYRNRFDRASYRLLQTMGVSQESRIEAVDELSYQPVIVDEAEAMETARRNRPDLAQADLQVGLQSEAVAYARSGYFPSLDAYMTATTARPDPSISNLNDWGETWRAGVNLRLPVFDGFARKGRLVQERASLSQREIERLDRGERAALEIREMVRSVRDAAEAVEAQSQTVAQATEGLRLAEVGYREGTLEQVSVLEARSALTQAQYLYFESLYLHALARLSLERAKGTLAPVPASADAGAR